MARDTKVYGSGAEKLSERIRRAGGNLEGMTTLGSRVREILIEGNERDRRAGRNRFGHNMPQIKESTARSREQKGRGKGPYLAPGPGRDRRESRVLTNYFVKLEPHRGAAGFRISWGWRAMPWLQFFVARTQTDISGISPTTGRQISDAIRDHLGGIFER